ncbi:MAG: hypothetical protein HY401_08305 [Elusimicrobia bacterium]|nr:hypothetical protein [Elusimicrobiota bacterium]
MAVGVILFLFLSSAWAQEPLPRVGRITIERINVFDPKQPGENRPPYIWVNKLHILTKEHVVRRELLMSPGDPLDRYLLENSERNLRGYPFIKDAWVATKSMPDGTVDLSVKTQDTWTTDFSPTFGFGAGEKKYGVILRERNFLGLGKTVDLNYVDGFGRLAREIGYRDPRIAGTRFSGRINHADFGAGYDTEAFIGVPVYSLVSPLSMGILGRHSAVVDPLFARGGEVARVFKERRFYEVSVGHPVVATTRRALRSSYGFGIVNEQFGSSVTASGFTLPENRKLRMLHLNLSYEEADFLKENWVNLFERYEDFNLGFQSQIRLSYSAKALGATRDEFLPKILIGKGKSLGPGRFALAEGEIYFIYGGRGFSQVVKSLGASYHHKRFLHPKNTAVLHAEASQALRLRQDSQLLLGGNAGLRGYRFNAFTGNRSVLFNAETRFYLVEDWLHVVSIAPILFWDAGYVWPMGKIRHFSDLKHDAGFGFRFGLTRSATAPVVRMDVSYAFNRAGTVRDRWVFSAGIKHAFGPFTNSLGRVSRE